MDKEELKCSICFKRYNTKELLPRIIPICGHTLCSECIQSALQKLEPDQPFLCPFDNKKFNLKSRELTLFPKNFTLAKVIEKEENERQAQQAQVQKPAAPVVVESIYPLCQKHNKPRDLACIEDRDITCSDCGLFGDHKNHDLRKIDDLQKLVQKKAKLVEDMQKAIHEEEEVYQKMITTMINTKKREIEETIEIKFAEYIKDLNKRKQELQNQAVIVFERLFNYYGTERLPENEESVAGVKKAKDDARNNYEAFKSMNPQKVDDICFDMVAYKIEDAEREVKAHLAVIKNNYQAHVAEKLKPICLHFDENFILGMEVVCQLQTEVDQFKKIPKPILPLQPVIEHPHDFHTPRENGPKKSHTFNEDDKGLLNNNLIYLNVEESKIMEISKPRIPLPISKETPITPKPEPNYPSEDSLKSLKQYGLLIEISDDDRVVIKGSRKQHHMITDETATKLYMILRRMTKCAALTLNLGGCGYQITSQGLTIIAAAFPALPELKYLEINFRNGGIGDSGISAFSNSITKMSSLKKLRMFFTDCQKLTDRALTELGLSIAKSTLTDLELNFAQCSKVSDKGVAGLSTSLSKISKVPGLNKLILNFEGCDKISDNGMVKLVGLFPDMPWAETLDLNFKHCPKVTNASLASLCQYMEKSKNTSGMTKFFNLKSLGLSFGSCDKIDNKGLMMVAEQVSKFQSLETCSIDFSYCDAITDTGLTELSKSLIKLKSTLKTIRLNFQGCEKVTETGVVDVSLFVSNLSSLNNLKLVFSDCKKLNDDVIGVLSIKLCNLNSLKHLHLAFSRCNEITNDSIIGLSHALKNLWTIEDLGLFFDYCTDIGNTGLQALSESLGALTSTISQLKINFSHCERVGDPGITRLSETLSQLIYLRELELFFVSCTLISGEGIIKLGESLEKLNKLDIIQIYFHGCGQIDENAKNKLTNIGAKVPQNYIFI